MSKVFKSPSQISPVVAATSAAQVLTSTQPVTPIIATGTQTLTHKEAQTKAFSQIADRRREHAEFRSHVIKNIKSDIYSMGKGMMSSGKGMMPTGKGMMPTGKGMFQHISSNIAYRLIFMFLFFFVFYKIIYNICIFFGIDQIILNMYLGWVSFLLVLFTFLPHEYGNILDSADVPAAPV